VKEFWIYTGLRALLFVASLTTVIGVWLLVADQVPLLWAFVIAFGVSGLASYVLLARSREALALRVQERADRASVAFEARRAREDAD
jgi:ABC-type bacteriocin/lantibiotic exporter with double-glycine peptidase domain